MGRQEAGIDLVDWSDSGWVGAGDQDDLDERLLAEEEPVDERQPHVMTALGPIEPAALGLTLVGDWGVLLVGPDRDPGSALLELEQLYATGVRAVVELDPMDTAARRGDLAWLSARSPVHIVTSAGNAHNERTGDATSSVPVRTGLSVLQAEFDALPAVDNSRLPVFVELANALAATLAATRATSEDCVPMTAVADPLATTAEDNLAVLAAGARLVLTASDDPTTMPAVAARFKRLADAGFSDRLGLGYAGDPISVMERIPICLMEAGLTSIGVRQILVDNPLQSLLISGRDHATAS